MAVVEGEVNSPQGLSQRVHVGVSQRVHVGIWSMLRAQRGSHIPTLRPKYIPYIATWTLWASGSKSTAQEGSGVWGCLGFSKGGFHRIAQQSRNLFKASFPQDRALPILSISAGHSALECPHGG